MTRQKRLEHVGLTAKNTCIDVGSTGLERAVRVGNTAASVVVEMGLNVASFHRLVAARPRVGSRTYKQHPSAYEQAAVFESACMVAPLAGAQLAQ